MNPQRVTLIEHTEVEKAATMYITHLGHACVLLETDDADGTTTRVLLDPGNFTGGLADIPSLDAVLITHDHVDHVDPQQIAIVRAANPSATMYGSSAAAAILRGCGVEPVELQNDIQFDIGHVHVDAARHQHEPIHPELPQPENYSYLLAGSVLHPGDCWAEVGQPVDTLLLPIGGPWLRLSDSVEYLRRVRPRVAIPIHQQGLVKEHQQLHIGALRRLAPEHTDIFELELGTRTQIR